MNAITQTTKFYVERPADKDWNVDYPREVIEAMPFAFDSKGLYRLKVLKSDEFATKWPSVLPGYFVECSGPARSLSFREYVVLVHSLLPKESLPIGFKIEADQKIKSHL